MVHIEDKEGKTAMYHACAAGNAKMVVLLQKHKAKIVLGRAELLRCRAASRARRGVRPDLRGARVPAKKFPTLNTEQEFKAARKRAASTRAMPRCSSASA